jgi:tryptophan synthase alpha chain
MAKVGADRFVATFQKCKSEGRAALSVFISAGDPDVATTLALLKALPGAGADIIELGMPFTDPVGDGAAVQRAGQRALKAGVKLRDTFELVRAFRQTNTTTPVALMGYYNTVYSHGNVGFLAQAAESGADALIAVDLPPEEDAELWDSASAAGISLVRFVAPNTSEARLPRILKDASGFVYLIALEGVTGAGISAEEVIAARVATVRRFTDVPIAIGFGIKTAGDVKRMSQLADAAIVGTVVVDTIKDSLSADGKATAQTVPAVLKLVGELKSGLRKERK